MQIKYKFLIVMSLILIFLGVHSGLFGGTTGKIAGQVVDAETGEPLVGVNVFLEGTILGGATDTEGEYFIINIPPGTYSVLVRMMGYTPQKFEKVRVSVDLTTRVNTRLQSTVLQSDEVVVITAQKAQIQKDLTSSEVSVGAETIDQLPVRSVEAIMDLQAGVVRDASGNLHIRGGRTSEITYMVDGVQVLNPLDRSAGISIDDQAIKELKAITGTFNAEYGQALSGVVNIVTKQGEDKFRLHFTSYFGDHLSFDDDVYYVMDNTEWANEAARGLNRKSKFILYDITAEERRAFQEFGEKDWLETKPYLNHYEPWKNRDLQLNISGPLPLTSKRISYFISGRYQYSPGYNHGKRYFMPWGFQAPVSDTVHTFEIPDNKIVPLNWFEGFSTQSKIYFKITNALNLSYGLYYNHHHSYGVGDATRFKYIPDAGRHYYTDRYTQILSMTYIFSKNTFIDFKGSYYVNDHENYMYEDPFDYRYMPTQSGDFEQYVFRPSREEDIAIYTTSNDFAYWGNDPGRSSTLTKYFSANLDLTSQVTKRHLMKMGISARLHDLENDYYNLQFSQATYRPIIPPPISPFHIRYSAKPQEFAAYIQDKIEFQELIINIGLRFDYFSSDGRLLNDPRDPQIYSPFKIDNIYQNYSPTTPDSELVEYSVAEREAFWYTKPDIKYQISPRFGLSFPITETGVIHFSYGHFFQNPEFRNLYQNPNFWITGAGAENLVGNANLNAERTVMYEIGLQQQVINNLYLHVTGFYRDIRDWVGTGIPIDTYRGLTYYNYVNRDHATAKGITLSSSYTLGNLSVDLDYTFMTAKGTSSDPRDAYNDLQSQRAPRVQLINLDWDQTQSLNLTVNYRYARWMATLIGTANAGLPYTPSFARGESQGGSTYIGLRENSERKPATYNVDLRFSRAFNVGPVQLQAFCNITNLFDTRNANWVYSDTGRPDFTLEGYLHRERFLEISSIDEFYARPGMYTPPRFIQFGFRVSY